MTLALVAMILASAATGGAEPVSCRPMGNGLVSICDGIVTTDGEGRATIAMPRDWTSSHDRFRYQLTVVGESWARARVAGEIADGRFEVETDAPQTRLSWQVTGLARAANTMSDERQGADERPPLATPLSDAPQATGFWNLEGNAGNGPTNFLGTTDFNALEFRVANTRALRIEPATIPNLIGGHSTNSATGVLAATIGGGGSSGSPNRVTNDYGTVAGGSGNQAGAAPGTPGYRFGAAVGGGSGNLASGTLATVAGGASNLASAEQSAVGGGMANTASGFAATVAGGQYNVASGSYSMVLGGLSNRAGGERSFAAGYAAGVRDATQSGDANGDEGTFIWSDMSQGSWFSSTAPNQFLVRAAGGVGINTNIPSPGGLTVAAPGKLTFGAQTRQMIDLWGPGTYGIGVQPYRQYFRVDNGASFAWYKGGSHTDAGGPGSGGTTLMRLDTAGNLFIAGTLTQNSAAPSPEMLEIERLRAQVAALARRLDRALGSARE